ncbi:MAG: hypothetical protein QOG53_1532 [Frankiales bacterium]|nr:hypothetical protein [Frankiales bacterium]
MCVGKLLIFQASLRNALAARRRPHLGRAFESFNGHLSDELLNGWQFDNLLDPTHRPRDL